MMDRTCPRKRNKNGRLGFRSWPQSTASVRQNMRSRLPGKYVTHTYLTVFLRILSADDVALEDTYLLLATIRCPKSLTQHFLQSRSKN